MRPLLVRHRATVKSLENRLTGQRDAGGSVVGDYQAGAVGACLTERIAPHHALSVQEGSPPRQEHKCIPCTAGRSGTS